MIGYEIWLSADSGERLSLLDQVVEFGYTRGPLNSPGGFFVRLPGDLVAPAADNIIEIWRGEIGGLRLEFAGFVRTIEHERRDDLYTVTLSGQDAIELLDRRIVAYYAGSTYADKTTYADDLLKAIIRENLGSSSTDTDRDWTTEGLSVQADVSAAPSISKGFAWRNLLTTCQEVAEASRERGTRLYFDVVPQPTPSGQIGFEFRTYTEQRGSDRTIGGDGGSVALFGETLGNLTDTRLTYDYTDECSVVYAGGQGEGSARTIVEVEDTARTGRSIWGRIERFADARNSDNTTAVTDKGYSLLSAKRARTRFSGSLLDSPQARYGVDWDYGDQVTCYAFGQQFDGEIRSLEIRVDGSGKETIKARVEVDE